MSGLTADHRIAAAAFYAVNAWQKETGRPLLLPSDGGDIPPLDEAMQALADEIVKATSRSAAQGCVCPPGAEKTCQGALCPRRPIKVNYAG